MKDQTGYYNSDPSIFFLVHLSTSFDPVNLLLPLLPPETDYNPGPYQALFAPGDTSAIVLIASLPDACAEQQESFTLNLQLTPEAQAMNVQLGTPDQATVDLEDQTCKYNPNPPQSLLS